MKIGVGVKILIAAGGSGGHIFPAVALAQSLKAKAPGADILFVGSDKDLDRRIFQKENFRFALLSANKLPYRAALKASLFLIKLLFDIVKSFFIIIVYKPNAVVGFGGYVSGPVILASRALAIPRLVHEQNVIPGRANRLLFNLADKVAISFDETKTMTAIDAKKVILTGNPIRSGIFKGDKKEAAKILGFSESKFTILVIGGSQGAHFLNETFVMAIASLDERCASSIQVIHIAGMKDYEWVKGKYNALGIAHRAYSFIDRIDEAYRAADLAITRAGSSAIFELAFFARPMILVPYPFANAHQLENALVFSKKGAAIKIEEKDLSADILRETILGLVNDRGRLRDMGDKAKDLSIPNASENLAEEVLSLVRG